jgi:hypothetical protein
MRRLGDVIEATSFVVAEYTGDVEPADPSPLRFAHEVREDHRRGEELA